MALINVAGKKKVVQVFQKMMGKGRSYPGTHFSISLVSERGIKKLRYTALNK